jgi:hypothetical protein
VKSAFKGSHFRSVDEMKLKTADLLNSVSADDLQHCFKHWKIHKHSVQMGSGVEEYVEGGRN